MTHWTVSRLKDYETCPARYDYANNQKWPGIKHPAASRGILVHESCEHYLQGKTDTLHTEIAPIWRAQLEHLRDMRARAEVMWELTEGWHPRIVDDEPLWLRAKIDAHYKLPRRRDRLPTLALIDFKTGKPYHANIEQLEVYALIAFAIYDDIEEVLGSLWYFDAEEPHDKTFTRSQAPKLARKWEGRSRPLLEATSFPHRPGRHCGWCPFRDTCPKAFQTA